MRPLALAAMAIGLCGCSLNQAEYSAQFTVAYCEWLLDCEDPAVLTFDGIHSAADCEAIMAPEVTSYGTTCKYKGGKANKCLDAMENLACSDDGSFQLPAQCEAVYPGCTFGEEEEETTDTDGES